MNIIGNKIFRFKLVDSTNTTILSEDFDDKPTGSIIVAEAQTAGIGRLNRSWESPIGGLYFSILFHDENNPGEYNKLTILFAAEICEICKEITGDNGFKIKWPNDVYYGDKKVCGILNQSVSMGTKFKIASGIGINVNSSLDSFSSQVAERIASLRYIAGKKIEMEPLFSKIIERFNLAYNQFTSGNFKTFLPALNENLYKRGEFVQFRLYDAMIKYKIIGIAENGELTVEDENENIRNLNVGEIM